MSLTRRLAWLLLGVLAVSALSVAMFDNEAETSTERIQRLSDSYACPTCVGQTVAESNASSAATVRELIRTRVNEGATDTEIRDELILAYGGEVLLTPRSDGISSLIWILPVLVAVAGSVAVVASVRRSPPADRSATDDDRELVERALTASHEQAGDTGDQREQST